MRGKEINWNWSTKSVFEQNEKFERFDELLIEKTKCIKEHVKMLKDFYSECYLVVAHILNRTSSLTLSWNSSLIFMQKLLKELIRNEIAHLKMFNCNALSLFKKADAFKKKWKNEISNFHRIFDRIWLHQYLSNLKFKERRRKWLSRRHIQWNEVFQHVQNDRSFQKRKKTFYVTYRAISLQIFENNDEKQYDKISIRKHVLNNSRKNVVSKSMMKKKISSSIEIFRLSTFNDTSSFKFESASTINIFVIIEISRQNVSMKNKKMISFFRKIKSLNKENNFSFRKNNFLCSHSSNLSNDFFEIENAFLNVLISKNINSRIDEINIVKKKRVWRSSKDFANTIWTSEKIQRIFVFHTTMMIVFNTKASKFEIKTTSSFKFHISNVSKSFFHWKVLLRHSYAEEFLKAA
jgi:hypothetical protein